VLCSQAAAKEVGLMVHRSLSIFLSYLLLVLIIIPTFNFLFSINQETELSKNDFILKRHVKFDNSVSEYFSTFNDRFYNLSSVEKYSNLYYDTTFSAFISKPQYEFKEIVKEKMSNFLVTEEKLKEEIAK
jgi:predicted PurR-regulated permease PerM